MAVAATRQFNRLVDDASDPRVLIQDAIHAQVAATPDRVAAEFLGDGRSLTYAALAGEAAALAARLLALGAGGRDALVALQVVKSVEMAAAILGVLDAGAAYLPLDPTWPAARRLFVCDDAACGALVVNGDAADGDEAAAAFESRGRLVALSVGAAAAGRVASAPRDGDADRALCYVIYTSGSTGAPKGVMIEHASLRCLMRHAEAPYRGVLGAYESRAPERCAIAFNYVFDAFQQSYFFTLGLYGGTCVLVRDGLALLDVGDDARVTLLYDVASVLALYEHMPASVKLVQQGGEAMTLGVVRNAATKVLWNWYGPTEATINATRRDVPLGLRGAALRLDSLGRPLPNVPCYVVDPDDGALLGAGAYGELWLGGVQAARGYLNRPELTADRFVDDPFLHQVPGAYVGAPRRAYRTGDRVRWLDDGELEFGGRLDFQVKLRGRRIELGEIEHACRDVAGVLDACVLLRTDVGGEPRLVGYVCPSARAPAVAAALEASSLPAYMVPAHLVGVDAWPRTSSGKIDRGRLAPPALGGARGASGADALLDAVGRAFRDELGRGDVPCDAPFFALGGSSLGAVRVRSRLARDLSAAVPADFLFRHPSVAEAAGALRSAAPRRRTGAAARNAAAARRYLRESLEWLATLDAAGTAFVRAGATAHATAILGWGARAGPRTRFGAGCRVGPGALVGHDTSIGADAAVGANCCFGGNVVVEPGAVVEDGCAFKPGVRVGSGVREPPGVSLFFRLWRPVSRSVFGSFLDRRSSPHECSRSGHKHRSYESCRSDI